MARLPETRYAKGPGGNIAYQVVGDGPIDLVIVPGWFSHVDMLWGDPGWANFVGELASFARVILYDKLGTGLSDPVDAVPNLESRADDLRAVLDAASSDRPALFGFSEGGPISVLLAATFPERVRALVLYGSYANGSREDDGSPGRAKWLELLSTIRPMIDHWGEGQTVEWAAPSMSHNILYRRGVGAFERAGMSPRMALITLEAVLTQVDVRDILGSVHVPTLVLHRRGDAIPVEFAREIAAKIPKAKLIELEGVDHWPGVGDTKSITDEVEEFLTGHRHEHPPDRVLATVMFTDIVDSTRRAAELGDHRWRSFSSATMKSPERRSRTFRAARSSTPAMASWRPLTGRHAPYGVPPRWLSACRRSASRSEAACTPANASYAAKTSAASPCTSGPESLRWPKVKKSLYPAPSRTSSTARASRSKTAARTC